MPILQFIQNNSGISILLIFIVAALIVEIFRYLTIIIKGYNLSKKNNDDKS